VGRIEFEGRSLAGVPAHQIVRRGLVQVPEGRQLFPGLTVLQNLEMGAYAGGAAARGRLGEVLELFPILSEQGSQVAGTLSGGQQQMLAIGRALMAGPRLLMLDEPSLGLDPKTTAMVFEAVNRIRGLGVSVLVVEQNAARTLRMADRAYVLESGEIKLAGPAAELLADPALRSAYLGL
jgi:branched-chain amino acid transport system ATP-binding protein